jgi:hypothetical protein
VAKTTSLPKKSSGCQTTQNPAQELPAAGSANHWIEASRNVAEMVVAKLTVTHPELEKSG